MPRSHRSIAPAVQTSLFDVIEAKAEAKVDDFVSLEGETWREIPQFAGYDVSDMGRVRSWWKKYYTKGIAGTRRRLGSTPALMPVIRRKGSRYLRVHLYDPILKCVPRSIHELVLTAFVGPSPGPNMVARHFPDPTPTNNRLDNLSWGTRSENMLDAIKDGASARVRLTEAEIPAIWTAIQAGKTYKVVAREFGITPAMVTGIANRLTWTQVTDNLAGGKAKRTGPIPDPVYAPDEIRFATEEMWRPIEDWPNYRISTWGRIRSRWASARRLAVNWEDGRLLKPFPTPDGHLLIDLSRSPTDKRTALVHRLVLETFAGPCPDGMEGCHGDENPANNHIANLRWDTHSANKIDTYASTGTTHTKFTPDDIRLIREMLVAGHTTREIAAIFKVDQSRIRIIRRKKAWGHVTD